VAVLNPRRRTPSLAAAIGVGVCLVLAAGSAVGERAERAKLHRRLTLVHRERDVKLSRASPRRAPQTAVIINKEDSPDADYSGDIGPLVYTADGTFALSPASFIEVGVNAPGSDCFFLGSLENIGH
jgi:hypothetical protein